MGNTLVNNTFTKNIIPTDDADRLQALRAYNLLDIPPDDTFQNLVHLIAQHFNVPIALISLVDETEVYFKGNVGMKGVEKVNRGMSLCSLAILTPEPTVITQPLTDPCLMNNPLVHKEFGLRFYAAAPLITAEGYRIGSVCIVDKNERTFTEKQREQLVRFAKIVMHDMDLRLSVQKRERQLDTEVQQRQKLIMNAVLQAQEKERSRMGRELHNNVNQILTTVKLYNEMALDPMVNTKDILKKSNNYLQECINEIRFISKQLSTPTLGDISLTDSIEELAASVNSTGKLMVDYQSSFLETMPISQDLRLAIFRIIQEQLNNILKHAKATKVILQLHGKTDGIYLDISDDGIGFETGTKKSGIGLINMRTRAENLNGKFVIKSAPGNGCEVKIVLPYYLNN